MADLIISQYDKCPSCKKKLVNLIKERNGQVLRLQCNAFLCSCGNCYFPKSMVAIAVKRSQSPIVQLDGDDLKLVRKP